MITAVVAGVQALPSLVGGVENLFGGGGSARDAARQARVNDFLQAAEAGSIIAGRILIAGPSNVSADEKPMWTTALGKLQAARPDIFNAAFAAGPFWHPNDDAASDGLWNPVLAELASIGNPIFRTNPETASPIDGKPLSGAGGSTSPLQGTINQLRTDLATGVQQIGTGLTTAAANGIAPAGSKSFLTIPTTTNGLLLWALVLGGGAYIVFHKRS